MRISVICFTARGKALAEKLKDRLLEEEVCIFYKHAEEGPEDLGEWMRRQFQEKNAVVLLGACGIAVRLIAPCLTDKLHDIPVLCMDEAGQFAIPILSGHMGGANVLAKRLAEAVGAVPVLTTATEVNDTFAVDLFAKRNHLTIQNKEGIARITAKVLENEMVDIVISPDAAQLKHGILRLKPKEYVIGFGCKSGKSYEEISAFITDCLTELNITCQDVLALASIDLKRNEAGLITFCNVNRLPFYTFSAEELASVKGSFSGSDFVRCQTGVDNVCERAAMLAAGDRGFLVLKKCAGQGMTLAVAKKKWQLDTNNQEGIRIDEA